jgi:hypothetical protein
VTGFPPPPARRWRSYGTEPPPTAADALQQPLRGLPELVPAHRVRALFQGKAVLSEATMSERNRSPALCVLISRISHGSCGGRLGRAALLSGIDDVSFRPVRRIVLRAG